MAPESEHQPFLSKDGEHTDTDHPHTRRHWSANKIVLSHFFVSLFTSFLWLAGILLALGPSSITERSNSHEMNGFGHQPHNLTTGATLHSCGNSATEAKSLGCKYDIFLNNWLPAPCYDEEWITEYRDDNSWGAYADEKLTQRLTPAEMEDGRDFYYTSLRDHINHCALMWNKQFWALYEERSALDTVIASPRHTEHCAQFLIDARDVDERQATKTYVGFGGCWIRSGAR